MPKSIPDAILDLMLDQAEGTQIHVCSAEPANYAAVAGVTLATGAIGAPTAAAGDVSGRKNTYPAVIDLDITVSGTATHVALTDNSSTLFLVTTCASQVLTSGGTVNTSAFDHEIQDPT